jgi:hypothetical protein
VFVYFPEEPLLPSVSTQGSEIKRGSKTTPPHPRIGNIIFASTWCKVLRRKSADRATALLNHSRPTSADVKKMQIYTSARPYVFMNKGNFTCFYWRKMYYPAGPVRVESMWKSMLRFCVYFKTVTHIQISNTRFKRARMKECHAILTMSAWCHTLPQDGRQVGVKITGSPRGKISAARERVCIRRCVRCRLTEIDEYYKIKH